MTGWRPPVPADCPEGYRDIMINCWYVCHLDADMPLQFTVCSWLWQRRVHVDAVRQGSQHASLVLLHIFMAP